MARPLSLTLAALLLLSSAPARRAAAQDREPPSDPVLRIETGMHTATIARIGVDAANRFLVTASYDKTARVWELPSGRLLRVLRVPVGAGNEGKRYYFLPHNADPARLLRTGVSFEDIKETVATLAGKTLFFIDTCHSGNVLGGQRALPNDIGGMVNELSSAENGAVVFAASTGNQDSLEDKKWNNGAFTLAVVEGFRGQAAVHDLTGRGRITVNMLDLYISERVKKLTAGRRTPTTAKPQTVPDFPIALKK